MSETKTEKRTWKPGRVNVNTPYNVKLAGGRLELHLEPSAPLPSVMDAVTSNADQAVAVRMGGDTEVGKLMRLRDGRAELSKKLAAAKAKLGGLEAERAKMMAEVPKDVAVALPELNRTIKAAKREYDQLADDLNATSDVSQKLEDAARKTVRAVATKTVAEIAKAFAQQRDELLARIAEKISADLDKLAFLHAASGEAFEHRQVEGAVTRFIGRPLKAPFGDFSKLVE